MFMMSATRLIVPHGTIGLHARISQRFSASFLNPARLSAVSELKDASKFPGILGLQAFSTAGRVPSGRNRKRDMAVYNSVQPGGPLPSGSPPNSWKHWLLGMLLSMVVPLWKFKLGPLLNLKNEVETAVETVEHIAEAVESVAEKVEEVADEIGNHLPDGGKLKEAFDFVENVAKRTAEGAHLVDEAIEKVEEFEKKVDSLVDEVEEVVDEVGGAIDKEAAEQNINKTDSS